MIVNSGKRLTNLIGDILDFSQIKNDNLTLYYDAVYMIKITDLVIALSSPLIAENQSGYLTILKMICHLYTVMINE